MNLRKLQLNAINEPVIIQQDHELIEYIRQNNIIEAYGYGDTEYFFPYIKFVNHPVNFAIAIITYPYSFEWLKLIVNDIIEKQLTKNGVLYLSINKFLASSIDHIPKLNDDYDLAIEEFIQANINASILSYTYDAGDRGQKFNFTHPLTRFYLKK